MTHLTDRHKECLKGLVKLLREGTIPEEFHITYDTEGRALIRPSGGNDLVQIEGLSRLGLEALTRAGYIFSLASYKRTSSTFAFGTTSSEYEYENYRVCYITPEGFRAVDSNFAPFEDILMRRPPIEITSSLAAFKSDFPDPSRLAVVMMQFSQSKAHHQILAAIRHALDPHQFVALRADDKQYNDDLLLNILTYVYGCRFGIAVFERIEGDAFNPNVIWGQIFILDIAGWIRTSMRFLLKQTERKVKDKDLTPMFPGGDL